MTEQHSFLDSIRRNDERQDQAHFIAEDLRRDLNTVQDSTSREKTTAAERHISETVKRASLDNFLLTDVKIEYKQMSGQNLDNAVSQAEKLSAETRTGVAKILGGDKVDAPLAVSTEMEELDMRKKSFSVRLDVLDVRLDLQEANQYRCDTREYVNKAVCDGIEMNLADSVSSWSMDEAAAMKYHYKHERNRDLTQDIANSPFISEAVKKRLAILPQLIDSQ